MWKDHNEQGGEWCGAGWNRWAGIILARWNTKFGS